LVSVDDAENYSVGDIVRVSAKQTVGVVAVLLCYVLPLIVMVAVLAIMVSFGFMEGTSALVALASLATYYAVLWLFRKRISQKVVFTIKPMASLVESRESRVESL
jgi:sigma-E factor negative regulatory protein RseC